MSIPLVHAAENDLPSGKSPPAISNEKDLQALKNRIDESRQLLLSIDELHANLVKIAEQALNDADAAPDLDMQRRYEQLYMQTSQRLGELQKTRAEIAHLLSELETRLETQRRGQ